MINNVALLSIVQQSDSIIHIHVSILFQIIFPIRLLHNIEQSSLCYTVVREFGTDMYTLLYLKWITNNLLNLLYKKCLNKKNFNMGNMLSDKSFYI